MDGDERNPRHLYEVLQGEIKFLTSEIKYLRKLIEVREKEFERRLEHLNNAAARAEAIAAVTVTRDVFEDYKETQDAKISVLQDSLEKDIAGIGKELLVLSAARATRAALWVSIPPLLLAVVGWFVTWFR